MTQCYAVIDIGTLKVKTEVAHLQKDGTLNRIYNSNNLTCFGVGLDENNGNVHEQYLDRTIEELQRIKNLIQGEKKEYTVSSYKVVSTHAMRRAKNKEYVLQKIKEQTGFEVENISQEQEAELFFLAVMHSFPPDKQLAVLDNGGGSCQVLIGTKDKLEKSHMMQTGAQYLHEKFITDPHNINSYTRPEDIEKMKSFILEELMPLKPTYNIPLVYGSSIIINIMQQINLPLEKNEDSPTHPYKTYARHLKEFIYKMLPYSFKEREALYNDVQKGFMWGIDKGFLTTLTIAEYLKSPYIIPSNANIAQGVLCSMSQKSI
jgi:exopolyphosphatase/guanosine-5'-triphosphate,3'-diphosphate pyrophosphatase